jgi:cell division transport system permease protein
MTRGSNAAGRLKKRWGALGAAELIPQARLSGPMPWVIAIMIAMTVIAAAAGLALRNAAATARTELSGGVTVQNVEPAPAARERQAAAAAARLRGSAGVSGVRLVPAEELDALISPWLGPEAADADAVPVPALIDARITGAITAERLAALRRDLRQVAPGARVDAQSSWLAPVFGAINSLQWLAVALIALLGAATAAAVLLAARSALGSNRDTIEIVHMLGGSDAQIARIFQRSIGLDAAVGGATGLALGTAAVLLLSRQLAGLGAGLATGGSLGWADWLVLALVPVGGVLVAMATARLTVIRALRKML